MESGTATGRRYAGVRIAGGVVLAVVAAAFLLGPAGSLGEPPPVRIDGVAGAKPYVAGASLTISGAHLAGVSHAEIDGSYAEIRSRDADHLEIEVPAVDRAAARLDLYQAGTRCFSTTVSIADSGTAFVNPLSPAEQAGPYRAGEEFSVRGAHLDDVTDVSIGDATAPIIARSDSLIRTTVPEQLAGGTVVVTVRSGDTVLSRQLVTLARPRVVFIGDSYTSGAGASSPATAAAALIAGGMGWDLDNRASGGTGYGKPLDREIARSACGLEHCPSYTEALESVVETPDILVIFGGRNQAREPSTVVAAEIDGFFARARELFPDTRMIVVDPLWDDDPMPATMREMKQNVRATAERSGVRYVDLEDPLDARPDLIGEDGVHPNDADYRTIADDFLRVVRSRP